MEMQMFHCYIGERRGGLVKFTTDVNCLAPDLIRVDERVFASERDMLESANAFRSRGFNVCVDTENIFQDYNSEVL